MANINKDPPDLVIYRTFKLVCSVYDDPEDFKYCLPLLTVNRQFRQADISFVYNFLFAIATNPFEDNVRQKKPRWMRIAMTICTGLLREKIALYLK